MSSLANPPPVTAPQPGASAPASRRPVAPRKRKKKRWIGLLKWAIVLLLLIGAGVGWWRWSAHQAALAKAASTAAEVVAVTRGDVEKSVDSSGGVTSNLDVEIKCRAGGEVMKLPFELSDHVKKGDLVCQLDPTDEKLMVRAAEVTALQSKAKLAQAQFDLQQAQLALGTTGAKDKATLAYAQVRAANLKAKAERQKELVSQKLGSQEDLETAQTEAAAAEADRASAEVAVEELQQQEIQVKFKQQAVAMAEAQLQADQITLDTQKQQLAYTTVTSPMDGVVSKVSVQRGVIVESGTNAANGGTPILTLSDLSRLFVVAKVDESDIGGVKVGQDARVAVSSYPSRNFVGKVIRIAPKGTVNSNIVTFEVTIEVLDKDKNLLMPEMTGNTTIIEERRAKVLTLPPSAVTIQKEKTSVKMADGTRRDIQIGLRTPDSVEIVSGLKEGDRVMLGDTELLTRWKNSDDD